MFVDLPVELWLRVARYLPQNELQSLYSVNRVFFALAMEEKYQVMRFETREQALRNVRYLSYPMASRHVRSLYLSPYFITDSCTENYSPKGILAKIFRRAPRRLAQQIIQVMHGFSGVTCLEVSWPRVECDLAPFLSVVNAGWATFGATLRSLTLDVSLETSQRAVSALIVFPRLEALQVTIIEAPPPQKAPILCEFLAPFINNHRSTLSSLTLRVFEDREIDISMFLLGLRHFPHLVTFKLAHAFVNMQASNDAGLNHFLELHARHLHTFSLAIEPNLFAYCLKPIADEWYGQSFLQVPLPKLEVLDIGLSMFSDVHRSAIYLHQLGNPLTSLTLRSSPRSLKLLRYHEVEILLNALTMRHTLRTLTLTVDFLTAPLLALLAAKVPALEKLSLEYSRCRVGLDDSKTNLMTVGAFRIALKSYNYIYTGWKLRHLTVRRLGRLNLDCRELCEPALQDSLPGVIVQNDSEAEGLNIK